MTMTSNALTIDLDQRTLVLEGLATDHAIGNDRQTMPEAAPGPMVMISTNRLALLELMVFAELDPGDDVVHLTSPNEIVDHLTQASTIPCLFMVDADMVEATRAELARVSLAHVPIIAT